jgi:LPXTG-motif cell wall-anchored protein
VAPDAIHSVQWGALNFMRRLSGISLAVASIGSVACVSVADAATVGSIQGEVSVNRGDGFRRVTGSSSAKTGDSVMVGSGSSAQVSYEDGCVVNVNPGAVYTVTQTSPCASGANETPQTGITTGQMAVGGALLAGAGAGIYFLTKKDKASSP